MSGFIKRYFAEFLWIPSAIIAAYLIANYSVDIPTIDQWDSELLFLMKLDDGTATFNDVIAPLIEHRLAINRLLSVPMAWLTGWDRRFSLWNTLVCASCLAIGLGILNRLTCKPTLGRLIVPNLLGGALILGIPQYDTWLNPTHIAWYLVECFLVACLLVTRTTLSLGAKVACCAVMATVATFTCGNGLLLWAVVLPVLIVQALIDGAKLPVLGKWSAVWLALAVIAIGRYFWDYEKPSDSPPIAAGGNLLTVLRFFVANVGCPFARGTAIEPITQASLFGAVILALAAMSVVYVLLHWRSLDLVQRTAPWIAIMAFGLGTGFAISLGRSGFGIDTAIVVRSIHVHVLTVYALIVVLPMIFDSLVARGDPAAMSGGKTVAPQWFFSRTGATSWLTALGVIVSIGHLLYCVHSAESYKNERARYLAAKTAVLFSRCFTDPQLLGNVWGSVTVRDIDKKLDFMDRKGFMRPKTFQSATIRDIAARAPGGEAQTGAMDQASTPAKDAVAFGGWAIFLEKARPADSVILTWETPETEATVFAISPVGGPRPDVVSKIGDTRFMDCGWGRVFPREVMPKHEAKIRAWAFDTSEGKAFPLSGELDWVP